MKRAYYQGAVGDFLSAGENELLGELARNHQHDLDLLQRNAWILQIQSLKGSLADERDGYLLLEYAIPRMGKRVDAVLLSGGVIFVLEYKVGATTYGAAGIDQVIDYALDLKNFHSGSHDRPVVPVLVATEAPDARLDVVWFPDGVAQPLRANSRTLGSVLGSFSGDHRSPIDAVEWCAGTYKPTPTIVEAARALYKGHEVQEISRSDAGAH